MVIWQKVESMINYIKPVVRAFPVATYGLKQTVVSLNISVVRFGFSLATLELDGIPKIWM